MSEPEKKYNIVGLTGNEIDFIIQAVEKEMLTLEGRVNLGIKTQAYFKIVHAYERKPL